MLDKTKKKKLTPEKGDGYITEVLEAQTGAINQLTKLAQDLQDQITDLRNKKDEDSGARRFIADQAYNPTDERLPEYSVVSNSAVEPFALALTCSALLDEDVLSGKKSVCGILLNRTLRLLRGKGGKLLSYAAEQAKEEARKESETGGDQIPLGQGM